MWKHVFGWYVVRCEFKNIHQKDRCLEEIGHKCSKHAIYSRLNNMGGTMWPLNEHKNIQFDNEYDTHMSSENYEANVYKHNLNSQISRINCIFHIL
jgi:hypothetical protein